MSLSPRITAAVANAMLAAGVTLDNGYINLYTGTQPSSGGGALSGNTLLVTLRFGSPSFGAPSGGVLTANAITPGLAVNTGTATWFRMLASDNTTVILDGSVGTSGCDMNLSSVSITSGDTIALTSGSITQPLM